MPTRLGIVDSRPMHAVHLKLTDRRLLYIFVVTIFVLTYFTWRSSSTARDAKSALERVKAVQHSQAVYQYNQCVRVRDNTTKINDTADASANLFSGLLTPQAIKTDPVGTTIVRHYIQIFENSKLTVPTCGERP